MQKTWLRFPTGWQLIGRIPFYLNLSCAGYIAYWTHKLELLKYPPDPPGDVTGFLALAHFLYFLSGFVGLGIAIHTLFTAERKAAGWATFDLVIIVGIFLVWFLTMLSQLQLGPSS